MHHFARIAIVFIAINSCFTGAWSQTVYKCGSNYSHIPCAQGSDGKVVEVDDARTQEQTNNARAETKRQAQVGDAMEKSRLKAEAKSAKSAHEADVRFRAAAKEKAKADAAKAKADKAAATKAEQEKRQKNKAVLGSTKSGQETPSKGHKKHPKKKHKKELE